MFKNIQILNKYIHIKKTVKNLIYRRTLNNEIKLGRWNLENNDIKTNIKVDSANEDHCGTCAYTYKNF